MTVADDDTKKDGGSDERQFLHDLASPIGTALFLVEVLLERVEENSTLIRVEELPELRQVQEALLHTKKLLEQRREILIRRDLLIKKS